MPIQPKRYSYYVGKKWTYLYAYTPRVVFKSVRALTSHISLDTTTTFKGGLFLPAKSSDTHTRRERTHLYLWSTFRQHAVENVKLAN